MGNLLGPCGVRPYGYDQGKPCVYLKLNKIYGVKNEIFPDAIKDVVVEGKKIPDELVNVINLEPDKDQVWVECHGEYPADVEALGNQLLHVECRAWAKNIGYNKRDRIGINHLELLIL